MVGVDDELDVWIVGRNFQGDIPELKAVPDDDVVPLVGKVAIAVLKISDRGILRVGDLSAELFLDLFQTGIASLIEPLIVDRARKDHRDP